MRLILTSDGLSNLKLKSEFLKMFKGNPKDASLLIIAGPQKKSHFQYIQAAKQSFNRLRITKIELANITRHINSKKFGKFDIILFMGGNTFYLLDRIRKTGFINYLKEHILSGRVFVGISAGSIIVHNSIEIAGWGISADSNLIGLQDLRGIGLTKTAVFPHYTNKNKKELIVFKKNTNYPIKEIRDGEAVIINGNKTKIIRK